MLREHVEPAGPEILAVALSLVDRVLGRLRLEELEAVAGHEDRATRLVESVVGAADALEQPRRALGRTHLHHAVDVAPVDPEVEARGGDERAQLAARHRAFDLAARLLRQRAVMDRDRQVVLVRVPQLLEDVLGEEARVGEDQRGPVALDQLVEVRDRPDRRVAAPRYARLLWQQDLDFGRRPLLALDQRDRIDLAPRRKPAPEALGIGHRRRQCRALHPRRDRLQASQRERQQVAALAGRESVDLVDHHAAEAGKQLEAVGIAQQQRQALGRGQQDVRRADALALLAVRRRVAAAGLDPDRQSDLLDRRNEVALDVARQRLERRDVERVQTLAGNFPAARAECRQRRQETGECLAGARVGDEQRMTARFACLEHLRLVTPHPPAAAGEPGFDLGR